MNRRVVGVSPWASWANEWMREMSRRKYLTETAINLGYDEAVARAMHLYAGPLFEHKKGSNS